MIEEITNGLPLFELMHNNSLIAKYQIFEDILFLKVVDKNYSEDFIVYAIQRNNNFELKKVAYLNID